MGPETAARVKADNVGWLTENKLIASKQTRFMPLVRNVEAPSMSDLGHKQTAAHFIDVCFSLDSGH